jgi:hypothetical protein
MPPLIARVEKPAAVEDADLFLPDERAVHVVTHHQSDRSEDGDDVTAIRGRRRIGLAGFRVTLRDRRPLERFALPGDFAGGTVDRVNAIAVRRQALHRLHVTVQTGAERFVFVAGRRHDDDAVAPHDRTRGRQSRYRRLPADVRAADNVPVADRALPVRNSRPVRAAKRWPWLRLPSWRRRGLVSARGRLRCSA